MTTILRLHVANQEPTAIRECIDCPCCHADGLPSFCALASDVNVNVDGPVPHNCPLPRLQIEVVERSAHTEEP